VALSKLAQAGLPAMEKVSGSQLLSAADGRKEYEFPTVTVVPGVPEMVGAACSVRQVVVVKVLPFLPPPLPPPLPMGGAASATAPTRTAIMAADTNLRDVFMW